VDRKLDLASRARRPFGDELRLDPAGMGQRRYEQQCEEN
jgi:hypothetical protein